MQGLTSGHPGYFLSNKTKRESVVKTKYISICLACSIFFTSSGCAMLFVYKDVESLVNSMDPNQKNTEIKNKKTKQEQERVYDIVKEEDTKYLVPKVIGVVLCIAGALVLGVSTYNDALPRVGNEGAILFAVLAGTIGMLPGLIIWGVTAICEIFPQKDGLIN
jgi:drug/metabolite transporter (DMT)-like permease